MDEESKKLIEETLELAKDNNEMLHSMRRSMRIARIMSILYWIIIIGSAIGVYYYIQPYVDKALDVYNSASNSIKSFNQ